MRYRYEIILEHKGLGRHRVLRGDDADLLRARGAAICAEWNSLYYRRQELDAKRQSIVDRRATQEAGLEEAEERTQEAQAALLACRTILKSTLSVDDRINFDELKRRDNFAPPPAHPVYRDVPVAPRRENPRYQPDLSLFDKLIPSLRRKKEAAAQAEFERDMAKHQADVARITDENQTIYHRVLAQHSAWTSEKEQFEKKKAAHNAAIDAKEAAYRRGEAKAVLDHCDMVLTRSSYPDLFPKEFTLDFLEASGTVIVDYTLPDYPSLPRLSEVRYNKSKDAFTEKNITESEAQRLYADLLVQTALRTVHELFEADTASVAGAVVFNGWVRGINPANGRMEAVCLASINTPRPTFLSLNLANVEPRLCFDQLGGVFSSKPHQMVGVRPLVSSEDNAQRAEAPAYVERLAEIASDNALTPGVSFITAGELRSLVGLPEEARASVQSSRQLVEKLNSDGYCVEPDASALGVSYKAKDELAVFKFPGVVATHPTPTYLGAATLLQLFHLVAAADGSISNEESLAIQSQVGAALGGDPVDDIRLKAYGQLLTRNRSLASSNLTKVTRRLDSAKREQVATALVHLAAADGLITEGEKKVLVRIFDLLALPAITIDRILPGLGDFQEKMVVEAPAEDVGETIPRPTLPKPAVRPPIGGKPIFALDASRIAAISRETSEVVKILSAVMADESEVAPAAAPQPAPAPAAAAPISALPKSDWELTGLDPRLHRVVIELFARAQWPMTDFSVLVARHHLMPAGLIDAVNSWSDEHLGDFVLEGDDPISIRFDLLKPTP